MSHSSPAELKSLIHARLTESGEKERLREHLRARLIECGWRDQVNFDLYYSVLSGRFKLSPLSTRKKAT